MSFRRRPLHTCGVSLLAIAHSACSRAQDLGGPLGSIAKRMVRIAKLVDPLVFALQYQWIVVLSFIDDWLLAIENIVEKIFPPSKLVFDKIDKLLHLIESFPAKFDDAINKFPCFNQVLFLDWAVVHAISLLKFLMTILMKLGREGTREKEILIDLNCNEGHNGYELAEKSECCSEGIISSFGETQEAETGTTGEKMKSDVTKGTFKEVREMGTKAVEDDEDCKENEGGTYKKVVKGKTESVEEKEDCTNDEKKVEKGIRVVEDKENCKKDETHQSQTTRMESGEEAEGKEEIADQSNKDIVSNKGGKDDKENVKPGRIGEEQAGKIDYKYEEANDESIENEDEILELFETAWLMTPARKDKGKLLSRSGSSA